MKLLLPLECVVTGPPVSHQSHNRDRLKTWQEKVRQAAQAILPKGTDPLSEKGLLVIVYFYDSRPILLDNDNLAKPIADALAGTWFVNDSQITDTIIRRTDITLSFDVRRVSVALHEALLQGEQFVYIRLEQAPAHENLL